MSLYSDLLILHSYLRWVIVGLLSFQLVWLAIHHFQRRTFRVKHFTFLSWSLIVYNSQLLLGWLLFFQSTIARQFWLNPAVNVKIRDVRFFGLEHVTMMTLAIIAINGLVYYSSKQINKPKAFGWILRVFLIITVVILASVPWSFSPFTHRPNFR